MKKHISGIVLFLAASTLAQEKCYEFFPKGGNQKFKAITTKATVIAEVEAQLKRDASERRAFISGKLQRGDGGHNQPWSWSLIKDEWGMAEVTVNNCNSDPNYVEKNLETMMVQNKGIFCHFDGQVIGVCPTGASSNPLKPDASATFRLESLGSLERIEYGIPRAGTASLELLRTDGTSAGRLDMGRQMAGPNTASWIGQRPAPGVYQLVLGLDGKNVSVKNIMLP